MDEGEGKGEGRKLSTTTKGAVAPSSAYWLSTEARRRGISRVMAGMRALFDPSFVDTVAESETETESASMEWDAAKVSALSPLSEPWRNSQLRLYALGELSIQVSDCVVGGIATVPSIARGSSARWVVSDREMAMARLARYSSLLSLYRAGGGGTVELGGDSAALDGRVEGLAEVV
jgi:hypothetical protein